MATDNQLFQVSTLQETATGILQDTTPQLSPAISNWKFEGYQNWPAQRGPTINFKKPSKARTYREYPTQSTPIDPIEERIQPLTVNLVTTTSFAFEPLESTFFDYKQIAQQHLRTCALAIGTDAAMDVNKIIESSTYRFYSPGISYTSSTPVITRLGSTGSYMDMMAEFRSYGFVPDKAVFLCDFKTSSALCNQALTLFTVNRNDSVVKSWELPMLNNTSLYQTNILQPHISGAIGDAVSSGNPVLLQVQTVTTQSDGGVSQITFQPVTGNFPVSTTGAKANDVFQFVDVSGAPKVRFLTFNSFVGTDLPVQCRVTQDAASTATAITLNFSPALYFNDGSVSGYDRLKDNITAKIVAGMQVQIMPSHRVGLVMSGQPIYIAAPKIPTTANLFVQQGVNINYNMSANSMDQETGVSILLQAGTRFPSTTMEWFATMQYGVTAIPEQMMRVLLPLN